MADWDILTDYVSALDSDDAFVEECWNKAVTLVDQRIGEDEVPELIVSASYLEVGADLFWRRSARNGIVGINSMDSSPVRINRDPIMACEAILFPFLSAGFA